MEFTRANIHFKIIDKRKIKTWRWDEFKHIYELKNNLKVRWIERKFEAWSTLECMDSIYWLTLNLVFLLLLAVYCFDIASFKMCWCKLWKNKARFCPLTIGFSPTCIFFHPTIIIQASAKDILKAKIRNKNSVIYT